MLVLNQYFQVTKIVQIIYNMPWFCASMFVYQSILVKLFLYIFQYFMGFYMSQKDQVFNPLTVFWPGFCRSTEPVDRRAQTCTASSGRRAGRPTRSTVQRALLSGKAPAGRAADRTESLLSVSLPRSAGRSTDGTTVWNMTVGRSAGRSTDRPDRTPTASFSSPINLGVWALFSRRFLETFRASFSYSFQKFFSTKLRANTSNQKGSFI